MTSDQGGTGGFSPRQISVEISVSHVTVGTGKTDRGGTAGNDVVETVPVLEGPHDSDAFWDRSKSKCESARYRDRCRDSDR